MRLMNTNFCTEDATTVTASTSDPSFPSSNLKHPFRSKRWRSTSASSQSVVFDMQTSEDIDSVVILWSKEDGINLSNTATIRIQANATNVWTSPTVNELLTINNTYEIASHYFTTAQSFRYWRVLIDDASNPDGYVELGMVWLGKGIAIENAQNGFEFSVVDRSKTITTEYGHSYTDEYPLLQSLQFSYANLEYDTVEILDNVFRQNGNKKPVLMVLDPVEDVYDKDHFVIYGKFQNDFGTSHVSYNVFNIKSLTIVELS